MRKFARPFLLSLALLFSISFSFAQTCNSSGTFKVGPTGVYKSLTAALSALRTNGVGGHVILELQAVYTSSVESFPLSVNLPCVSESRTVTIRPEAGAVNLSISNSNSNSSVVTLDNAQYIYFDGRPGGTGTTRQLTLAGTGDPVIRFVNDASFNIFRYVNIQGMGIRFDGAITTGNNNNTIEQCAIYGGSAGATGTVIYSSGTAGKKNTNNKVLGNLIYNYNLKGAVQLEKNTGPWEIAGNHFYNTGTTPVEPMTGISINDSTSFGFKVHDNFIGGSAPNCGGTAPRYHSVDGIKIIASADGYTSIQGNTVANIKLLAPLLEYNYFEGINMYQGKFKCGDVTGNTIGNPSQPSSISVQGLGSFVMYGIVAGAVNSGETGVDTCYIMNNKIGGLYGYQDNTDFVQDNTIIGIYMKNQKKGYADISGNKIGSAVTHGSITNATEYQGNDVYGIFCELIYGAPPLANKISNNEISHLAGKVRGIFIAGGKPAVMNNIVHHLYGGSIENSGQLQGPEGIFVGSTSTGARVSGNTVHSLTLSNLTGSIMGIHINLSADIIVEKNFVHTFQASQHATGYSTLTGIEIKDSRRPRVLNNMIRLGIDSAGMSTVPGTRIKGMVLGLDSSVVSNNSIWIGGTGNYESVALSAISATISRSIVRNNILVNTRTVTGSTAVSQFALRFESEIFVKQEFDYNIYYTTGANACMAYIKKAPNTSNPGNYFNIIDWRSATGQESHSLFYNPNFLNPSGNATAVNLHLANPNPAEGQGFADPDITEDIDNESRAAFSAADIGADAGNFSLQDGDAPRITHKAFLGNPLPTSFVYKVTVTDNGTGVDTVAGKKPRMWFRKKFPSTSAWSSLPGSLVSGNLNNGTWGFVPDFAAAGVPVAIGDSLEYYFVAQDKGPIINTGYSNVTGTIHTDVVTQTAAPTSPLRLLIYGIFADTVYVGAGQSYTSLTNDGGFFHMAKSYMFDTTKNHPTVMITSDLSESGTHEYTNINESGATITITTNTPVIKQIKHQPNIIKAVVTFRNVKNVTLDGSVGGSGRYLHFISGHTNTTSTHPALQVLGGGKGVIIRNTIFEGNGTGNYGETVYIFSNELDTFLIENNLFKNIEASTTAKVGLPNSSLQISLRDSRQIIIRKNEFTNFGKWGIVFTQPTVTPTGEILVDSNHFYYNSSIIPVSSSLTAINVGVYVKSVVTSNFIGGSQPYCGGAPWTQPATGTAQSFKGIGVGGDINLKNSVQNNTIRNIRLLALGSGFVGISGSRGSIDIGTEQPNIIGSLTDDSSIVVRATATGIDVGAEFYTLDSPFLRVENNIVAGITAAFCRGINFDAQFGSIKNNRVQNLTASGSLGTQGYRGLQIISERGVIEGNQVLNLTAKEQTAGWMEGMFISAIGPLPNELLVARNKVAGLRSYWNGSSSTAPKIIGMRISSGQIELQNNQVNITNGNTSNLIELVGIYLEGQLGPVFRHRIYNNTVRIGGVTSSTMNSYALLLEGGSPVQFIRNNIFYNDRTGGTGKHSAVGYTSASALLLPQAGNNNLFVTADTNKLNEYKTTGLVNLSQWQTLSKGDSASYAVTVADLPVDSLFANAGNHDLNINTTSQKSWYVNGKGLPVASVSGDFDVASGVRSTSITTGATDIGADEFNTITAPPALVSQGNHVLGGTETFSMNGRVIASITWGATGTLPTLGELRFYSGVWPNDTSNNGTAYYARYMNAYWHIPATGGSNYSYSITFHYDSSMLGKVTNASSMVINKKQTGVDGSWVVIEPAVVNTVLQTITIHNQTSFSEFTATDASATLHAGVPSPDLLITQASLSVAAATTGSKIAASFTQFNQGVAAAAASKLYFYISADNVLTPGANGDTLLATYDVAALAVNTATGTLSKELVIPCTLAAGNYKIFFVADGTGVVPEMDETNNSSLVSLAVSIGMVIPLTPVITATPETDICTPQTVTLTADAAGCTGCTYNWSTAATGKSITVNTTGTYTVTVTNSCGQSTGSRLVTIHTTPSVSLLASAAEICLGEQVTFTASGAASYSWSGTALNGNSGAVVTAKPVAAGTFLYQLIGNSNGCADTVQTSITVKPTVTPSVSINYTGCPSTTLNFSATAANGGTAPAYQWLVNDVVSGSGQSFTLSNAANGTKVSVVLTTNAGCATTATATSSVTVNCITTGVNDIDGLESYSLLPNPSSGLFEIRLNFNRLVKLQAKVTDVNGRVVYNIHRFTVAGAASKQIDLRHLPAGIYYLQVLVDKQSFTDKLLKIN